MIETITHLAFYSGWPSALTAISGGHGSFPDALTPSTAGTGLQYRPRDPQSDRARYVSGAVLTVDGAYMAG